MARDRDEDDKRRRELARREREDEAEREEQIKKLDAGSPDAQANAERFEDLLARIEPMLEQVDALYHQYVRGVELRPPLERRKILDQLVQTLSMAPKGGVANQFRYNSFHASYVVRRDRWDKMMHDLEAGKIKRIARPGAK